MVAAMTLVTGCTCDAFQTAVREHFIELIDEQFHLADREDPAPSGGAAWSVLYGPRIAYCPFCGRQLEQKRAQKKAAAP